ncbi:hypothetical protein KIPB_009310, partial [Kipferlia bialata]
PTNPNMTAAEAVSQRPLDETKTYSVKVQYVISQADLKLLSAHIGALASCLHIVPTYDMVCDCEKRDDSESYHIDFGKGLWLMENLLELQVDSMYMADINLTKAVCPNLETLYLNQPQGNPATFTLDLPRLRSIKLQHVTLDKQGGVGESFSRCPRLEVFDAYKFWGVGTYNTENKSTVFVLPNCHTWSMMRSDDADYMDFYCPKMRQMDLEALYALKRVNLLKKCPEPYANLPEYKRVSSSGRMTQFSLCLRDSTWPTGSIIGHPRLAVCEPRNKKEAENTPDANPMSAIWRQMAQAQEEGGEDHMFSVMNSMLGKPIPPRGQSL